jgi:alkylhydroperoxidase/carboxymuconolactone decarboxylase family protein YurZ
MPIKWEPLDSSLQEENITLILGKNILLKIIEDPEKQMLLNESVVKEFISISNLCHDEVRSLIEELMEEEERILSDGHFYALYDIISRNIIPRDIISDFLIVNDKKIAAVEAKKSKRSGKGGKFFEGAFKDTFRRYFLFGKVDEKFIQEKNKKLISLGSEIKERTGFDMLVPSNLLLCPDCKTILSIGEFKGNKKCHRCEKEIKRENAARIYVHKVREEIKEIWKNNLWFEAYVARLLRKLDCKTWTSAHVMGASGILHEVDVLAIKDGTVLVCECKTGKVSRNDVFNFCTKAGDLKAHISILALIGELPDPETREFVKKNPAIIRIENMGKMKEDEILEFLTTKLSIKG